MTIPANANGGCEGACYDLSGDPDWGEGLDLLAPHPPANDPGTATITWDLSPTGGSHGCVVPHLSGLTTGQASSKLKSAGCKLGKVTHKHSSSVHKGHVISSSPKAGSKRPAGTKVAVVLSER